MKLTLRGVSCTVYGLSFVVIALLSLSGAVGSVGMQTVVDWVLVSWLAGYASILVLLVGGTARAVFREIINIAEKVRKETVQC